MTQRKLIDTTLLFENGQKDNIWRIKQRKTKRKWKKVLNKKEETARREQEWKDKENKWEEGWHKG